MPHRLPEPIPSPEPRAVVLKCWGCAGVVTRIEALDVSLNGGVCDDCGGMLVVEPVCGRVETLTSTICVLPPNHEGKHQAWLRW